MIRSGLVSFVAIAIIISFYFILDTDPIITTLCVGIVVYAGFSDLIRIKRNR